MVFLAPVNYFDEVLDEDEGVGRLVRPSYYTFQLGSRLIPPQ